MPFKIVRNDITQMTTDAIVNTANTHPTVGPGCDRAVYKAAGYSKLLEYRAAHIGEVPEGEAFITPGFNLKAKYIIHAVSPLFKDGSQGEEIKLRACYRNSLAIAAREKLKSIAFPLISTGSFGYPREEGMRIAIDEIHSFLLTHEMMIYLVVFNEKATAMGRSIDPELEAYIDQNYVSEKEEEEYGRVARQDSRPGFGYDREEYDRTARERAEYSSAVDQTAKSEKSRRKVKRPAEKYEEASRIEMPHAEDAAPGIPREKKPSKASLRKAEPPVDFVGKLRPIEGLASKKLTLDEPFGTAMSIDEEDAAYEELERKLANRMEHLSDTFQEYLFFLIGQKGLKNSDVYKASIVDKKVFSKIKNNRNYHPQKNTALRLCIGAHLNLDEATDLLQRAGYALSPCDKTDVIFKFYIENEYYDIIGLDIALEEYGQQPIID